MEANLEGANLSEANLQYANLSKSDLRMAFLPGANLCYANLREANLYKANLKQADLRGYKKREVTKEQAVSTVTIMARSAGWLKDYSEDENKYTDLRTANLEGIDLNGAKYNNGTIWPEDFDPSKAGAIYED
ncbi:MAG: pentapeptide repeat-containing protein [Anaerolineae bacterium]|nr:pentapeptide repeat-containing protein [Anaerolineae bacterium]